MHHFRPMMSWETSKASNCTDCGALCCKRPVNACGGGSEFCPTRPDMVRNHFLKLVEEEEAKNSRDTWWRHLEGKEEEMVPLSLSLWRRHQSDVHLKTLPLRDRGRDGFYWCCLSKDLFHILIDPRIPFYCIWSVEIKVSSQWLNTLPTILRWEQKYNTPLISLTRLMLCNRAWCHPVKTNQQL